MPTRWPPAANVTQPTSAGPRRLSPFRPAQRARRTRRGFPAAPAAPSETGSPPAPGRRTGRARREHVMRSWIRPPGWRHSDVMPASAVRIVGFAPSQSSIQANAIAPRPDDTLSMMANTRISSNDMPKVAGRIDAAEREQRIQAVDIDHLGRIGRSRRCGSSPSRRIVAMRALRSGRAPQATKGVRAPPRSGIIRNNGMANTANQMAAKGLVMRTCSAAARSRPNGDGSGCTKMRRHTTRQARPPR